MKGHVVCPQSSNHGLETTIYSLLEGVPAPNVGGKTISWRDPCADGRLLMRMGHQGSGHRASKATESCLILAWFAMKMKMEVEGCTASSFTGQKLRCLFKGYFAFKVSSSLWEVVFEALRNFPFRKQEMFSNGDVVLLVPGFLWRQSLRLQNPIRIVFLDFRACWFASWSPSTKALFALSRNEHSKVIFSLARQ